MTGASATAESHVVCFLRSTAFSPGETASRPSLPPRFPPKHPTSPCTTVSGALTEGSQRTDTHIWALGFPISRGWYRPYSSSLAHSSKRAISATRSCLPTPEGPVMSKAWGRRWTARVRTIVAQQPLCQGKGVSTPVLDLIGQNRLGRPRSRAAPDLIPALPLCWRRSSAPVAVGTEQSAGVRPGHPRRSALPPIRSDPARSAYRPEKVLRQLRSPTADSPSSLVVRTSMPFSSRQATTTASCVDLPAASMPPA